MPQWSWMVSRWVKLPFPGQQTYNGVWCLNRCDSRFRFRGHQTYNQTEQLTCACMCWLYEQASHRYFNGSKVAMKKGYIVARQAVDAYKCRAWGTLSFTLLTRKQIQSVFLASIIKRIVMSKTRGSKQKYILNNPGVCHYNSRHARKKTNVPGGESAHL